MKARYRLPVLFEDDCLVAVHKPAGLVVHASDDAPLRDTCLRRVRSQTGRKVWPCHRLDRPTSGLLLFAFSPELAEAVFVQFRERTVEKHYSGLCRGFLGPEQHELEHPIDGRWALTRFATVQQFRVGMRVGRYPSARYSLLDIQPVSGRRHQIRRHLKRLGHPLVGDRKHGDRDHNRFWMQVWGLRPMFLHSSSLSLRHPTSGDAMQLACPLSPPLQAALEQLEEFRLGGTETR